MAQLTLDKAVELTRTGDVWVFRGPSLADHVIRALTNAPVNHVGMAVVLEDLPPLLWHAELGKSLPDAWTGQHQRGVQLHDLRDAVLTWRRRYGQHAWRRQLVGPAEDGGGGGAGCAGARGGPRRGGGGRGGEGGPAPAHHGPRDLQAVPDHPRA